MIIKNEVINKIIRTNLKLNENRVLLTLIGLASEKPQFQIDYLGFKRIINKPFETKAHLLQTLNNVNELGLINFTCDEKGITINDNNFLSDNIDKKFTKIDLDTFLHVTHITSQKMFLLLSMFQSTGYYVVKYDDFKSIMNTDYNFTDIKRFIFKAFVKDISIYCSNFNISVTRDIFNKKAVKTIIFKFQSLHQGKFYGDYHVVERYLHQEVTTTEEVIECVENNTAEKPAVKAKKTVDKVKNALANTVYKKRYYGKNKKHFEEKMPFWAKQQTTQSTVKQTQKNDSSKESIADLMKKVNDKTAKHNKRAMNNTALN